MRFWRRNTSKYERYKGRKSPDWQAITVRRRTAESCSILCPSWPMCPSRKLRDTTKCRTAGMARTYFDSLPRGAYNTALGSSGSVENRGSGRRFAKDKESPMSIYEFRTYTLKPGTVAQAEKNFGEALPERMKISPL